jgi:homoserine dehydrogenase
VRAIGVGLLGLGNVGSGLIKILEDNSEAIAARIGARIDVRRIAVREAEKPRLVDVDPRLITTDVESVLADPEVAVVVELIGGEDAALRYVRTAIESGKHVVTANKALLAAHGDEIFELAERNGVDIFYEASVGGGVPIIRALRDGLASDRIEELHGIVNGTSNYILTRMQDEGRPFDEILRDAQAQGYAEADPGLDVDGWDAAHKLCILTSLCFGVRVRTEQMLVEGLRDIAPVDFHWADRFGYVIKPLVIARDHGASVEARVHPTMIPKRWLLASVNGVFNAVYVSSQALGPSMYYGRGAGMMPTAVAVVSDLIEVARDILGAAASGLPLRLRIRDWKDRPIRAAAELTSRYYLRFTLLDKPGALAQVANVFAEVGVSIREVAQDPIGTPGAPRGVAHQASAARREARDELLPDGQREGTTGRPLTVVVTTHAAREAAMQAALAAFARLPGVVDRTRLIRIVE